MAEVGDLVRHDQVVLGVDGGLHAVADDGPGEQVQAAAQSHDRPHAALIAGPLSRRKSAMVLKSGISRPFNQSSSRLGCASRSRRRLDRMRFR